MPGPTYTAPITSVRDVAPDVRELTLAPPSERLEFKPGQWLSLQLPVGERPPLVRAYSLAAPPCPTGELVLCLDRVPGGLGSEYLFHAGVGDTLAFGGPLGNLVLPEVDAELLWIARYTGIVPFRAMLLYLEEHPPASPVTLLYTAPRPHDLAYHDELRRAADCHPWFTLVTTVEEPDAGWTGKSRPALELLPELVRGRTDLVPMVCGIREFVRPVRDYFQDLGYDRRAVKWESYD